MSDKSISVSLQQRAQEKSEHILPSLRLFKQSPMVHKNINQLGYIINFIKIYLVTRSKIIVINMSLPEIEPLQLSTSNPGYVEKYDFEIKLAQKTGTNGPRDLYTAYKINFFEKYAAAMAKILQKDMVLGYDGSRVHQSITTSAREYLRRMGINILELDGPVTVPEFMHACYKLNAPGCFFGRSHSPQQYIGLKLVINSNNAFELLEKNGAKITIPKELKGKSIYGFLPRTLAPIIEEKMGNDYFVHPKEIGTQEKIESKELREEFVKSLKKVLPMKQIKGNYIVDCRHSMAGEVWNIIQNEINAKIILHNNKLDPIAPDRDPREIWDDLARKYHNQAQAVFDHDADADRTFLVKTPGKGMDKIIHNQEESFTTGLITESREKKSDAYVLVQERISLIMLSSLKELTNKVYATAQGEPAFFLGVNELLLGNPNLKKFSGADYTNIFLNETHPICMKSPYQQALWLMHWFSKNDALPEFPSVDVAKTQIDMLELDYPQRLAKVFGSMNEVTKYFDENFNLIYKSKLDGQNLIIEDAKENLLVISIRPSGTGRYTKVFTEIGLGKSQKEERKQIAEKINKDIEKIIGK